MSDVDFRGDAYVCMLVSDAQGYCEYVAVRCVEDVLAEGIAAVGITYADLHGERVVNRKPLVLALQDDGNIIITDAKNRQWRLLGVTEGDPHAPDLVPWDEVTR